MRAAAVQMTSSAIPDDNLEQAARLLREAAREGADVAVLPENFAYMGARDADRMAIVEPDTDGPAQQFLAAQSRANGLWLVGGTIPVAGTDGRAFSRCFLHGPDGSLVAHYDKIHLFDVDIPDNPAESYRESDTTLPGSRAVTADIDGVRLGLAICYDLRFPLLFHRLAASGMDILAVPAAFTVPTGKVHWEPLLRARAIESLTFVIAAGQSGEHAGGRLTYGHSSIISPWGEILTPRENDPGLAVATLDLEAQKQLRERFPVLSHKRVIDR